MSFGARKLSAGAVGLAVVLAGLSAFGERGLARVLRLEAEVERIEALNRALEAQNARLVLEIQALDSDTRTLEAVAREELGLVRPGEIVFRFEAARPPAPEEVRP